MPCILLIDDDPQVRAALRQMLARAGYEVIEACNGAEGMACWQTRPPDLIITDVFMPEQDGLEIIPLLRRLNPTAKILAISGGDGRGHCDLLRVAQLLGAQLTLHKPVRRQALLEAVRALLQEPD